MARAGTRRRSWSRAGGGTAKAAGRCHAGITAPRRGATQRCFNALGSFAAGEEEEGRSPPGINRASWPPVPGWGPALPPGRRHPTGQDPPPPSAEQEGEEHPWVAKRVECVQHLARKCWLLRKHGTFHPRSGLSVFWGGGKGLPVTYQLNTTCCLSLLDGGSGLPRRPPTPRSSLLRVFGVLQAVVETQELSAGWDLLLRRNTKSRDSVPGVGSDEDPHPEAPGLQLVDLDTTAVGGIPPWSSQPPATSSASPAAPAGDIFCRRSGWFLDRPDPAPCGSASPPFLPIPAQGCSSNLRSRQSVSEERPRLAPPQPPGTCPGPGRHVGQSLHGKCSLSPVAIRTPRCRDPPRPSSASGPSLPRSPRLEVRTRGMAVGTASRSSSGASRNRRQTLLGTSLAPSFLFLPGVRQGPPGCLPLGFALTPHQRPKIESFPPHHHDDLQPPFSTDPRRTRLLLPIPAQNRCLGSVPPWTPSRWLPTQVCPPPIPRTPFRLIPCPHRCR